MYEHINDTDRRILLGMATQVDDGMKRIVEALEQNNMVDNTLLVWMSDVRTSILVTYRFIYRAFWLTSITLTTFIIGYCRKLTRKLSIAMAIFASLLGAHGYTVSKV